MLLARNLFGMGILSLRPKVIRRSARRITGRVVIYVRRNYFRIIPAVDTSNSLILIKIILTLRLEAKRMFARFTVIMPAVKPTHLSDSLLFIKRGRLFKIFTHQIVKFNNHPLNIFEIF